ncbi:E3 ubiquitin-protein ligase RMA1H1-like [Lotus japonicus]|uniref:E3 ubiquitin-protein ligase RMA1H1-like n=1 Tax=Lotus japonicus TaxID=34305 RepID=UPI00258AC459|nr:E3 ubiquitin-protein ligase RMA1H1-like [Lotus japonicus]
MASNQYFEEPVPQVDSFEEKSSSDMLKCACDDAIEDHSDRNGLSGFDCSICLDRVQDPVVTLCGHLYCWPCIYKWLNFHSVSSDHEEKKEPQCPVCKSEISESSLVPLYGRDQTALPSKSKAQQVRIFTPPRPLGPSSVVELLSSFQPTSQAFHPHPQQLNSISEDPLTRQQVEAEAARANTSLYNDVAGGADEEIIVRLRAAEAEASRLRETLALSHQLAETAYRMAEAAVHEARAATHEARAATQRAEATIQKAEAATEKADAANQKAEAATRKAEAAIQRAEAATQKAETANQKAEAAIANQKTAVVETNAGVDGMVATGLSAHSSTGTSQVPLLWIKTIDQWMISPSAQFSVVAIIKTFFVFIFIVFLNICS